MIGRGHCVLIYWSSGTTERHALGLELLENQKSFLKVLNLEESVKYVFQIHCINYDKEKKLANLGLQNWHTFHYMSCRRVEVHCSLRPYHATCGGSGGV